MKWKIRDRWRGVRRRCKNWVNWNRWQCGTQIPQVSFVFHKHGPQRNYMWDNKWSDRNIGRRLYQGTKIFGYRWRMGVCVLLCRWRRVFCLFMVAEHFLLACTEGWWEMTLGKQRNFGGFKPGKRSHAWLKHLGSAFAWFEKVWNKRIHTSENNDGMVGDGWGKVRSGTTDISGIGN